MTAPLTEKARITRAALIQSATELQSSYLAEWKTIYRDIQAEEGLDPTLDMDALLTMLWATELGLGVLESWDIELPKPATWARLVDRILASLEGPTQRL